MSLTQGMTAKKLLGYYQNTRTQEKLKQEATLFVGPHP